MKKSSDNRNGNKTFVRITNKDIFDELISLQESLGEFKESNAAEHSQFKQSDEKIKGKVNAMSWVASSSLAVASFLVAFLIYHKP